MLWEFSLQKLVSNSIFFVPVSSESHLRVTNNITSVGLSIVGLLVDDWLLQLGISSAAAQLLGNSSDGSHHNYVVIHAHAENQADESNDLQVMERLPSDRERNYPDHHRSDGIENLIVKRINPYKRPFRILKICYLPFELWRRSLW